MTKTPLDHEQLLYRCLNSGGNESLTKLYFDAYISKVSADLLNELNKFNYSSPKFNEEMLQEAIIKLLLRLRDERPQAASRVKKLASDLSLPERGDSFSSQVEIWTAGITDSTDRAMSFFELDNCKQRTQSINAEFESLQLKGEDLLHWIDWKKALALLEESNENDELDMLEHDEEDSLSDSALKERREQIKRRIKELAKLAKKTAIAFWKDHALSFCDPSYEQQTQKTQSFNSEFELMSMSTTETKQNINAIQQKENNDKAHLKQSKQRVKTLTDWIKKIPIAYWTGRTMNFCELSDYKQQKQSNNTEGEPWLGEDDLLNLINLERIQVSSNKSKTDIDLNIDNEDKETKEYQRQLIKQFFKPLAELSRKQASQEVETEIEQVNGTSFVFDTGEILELVPLVKIPSTNLLLTIAKNKIRDIVDKNKREISFDEGWDGEDNKQPIFEKFEKNINSESSVQTDLNAHRKRCRILLYEPLKQAKTAHAVIKARLQRFREEKRPPRIITEAERERKKSLQDLLKGERKRYKKNSEFLAWIEKDKPKDYKSYTKEEIAEELGFSNPRDVYDRREDISELLSPLSPYDYLVKVHTKLVDFLIQTAQSNNNLLVNFTGDTDDERRQTQLRGIDKLLKFAIKLQESKLSKVEYERLKMEDRLAKVCLKEVFDPDVYRAERQQLIVWFARSELGDREIVRRWKKIKGVKLEVIEPWTRKWRKANESIEEIEVKLAQQRNHLEAHQAGVIAVALLLLGQSDDNNLAQQLGLSPKQVKRRREQIHNVLRPQPNLEQL